ncbi:hypothetical protein BY90_04465 [Escherichia coli O157:H7 str. K5609]|nr:hypothetical protein BY90_04465 [Escherichia coli O157:H7 str. K5609]
MPVARYLCIFINVGLGEAAKRDVGTGENQIPDMASFAMVRLFLLKNTRNWQRLTRQINCLIYAVNLFVDGMMGAGWIPLVVC